MTIIASVLFSACGGGGDNGDTPQATTMEQDLPYEISKGQTIFKKSNDAQVSLKTNIETGVTTAILMEGSASIK